ncbi:hypothetical protein, partial [Kitasatospora cineracea]|uniref:hypothetical protein n=1 Tax=Kitasatospora cineracea TaxID=88074 RepID=UPI00348AD3EC
LTGRETRGAARTNASWWRPGTVSTDSLATAELGAIALDPAADAEAGARIDWDRIGAWISSHARVPDWVAGAVTAAGRGLSAVWAAVRTVGRGLGRWHHWRYAGRAAARVGALATTVGLVLQPAWTILALACAVPVVLTAAGLWGAGYEPSDRERYAPGLWAALVQVLRLSQEDQERGQDEWLHLTDSLSVDTAAITIRLPLGWLGSDGERGLMTQVLHSRVPGEWVAQWEFKGNSPYVRWTPKPPPAPAPELPTMVEWVPSEDPSRVMVGITHDGPRYVDTAGETPHWGVSGGTGDGKTTVLLMPVVHGRQHGALVDCITMKSNAFKDIEGESGVRVHKSGRAGVAAMAEFYTSMKAAEGLQGTPEGDVLPGRILVIDEFASFVKSAKIWWKYGLQAKGMPPFEAWFHMILMQGRSADHKIVIGAHTFTRELFGDTETRDLVGTKGIVGPASNPKWLVTYGDAPRVAYDSGIKGRGVIGVTGRPEVEEIQYAYITPVARKHIRAAEDAPDWFDRGEMAPWITPAVLDEAEHELAIADFLPGGAYMEGVTLVTDGRTPRPGVPTPRSEHVTSHPADGAVTGRVTLTKHGQDHEPTDVSEEAQTPVYSLKEASTEDGEAGILPARYGALRKRISRGRKRGIEMPEGITVDGTTYYTEKEIKNWWKLTEVKGKSPLGN